jgi:hypothetical protein
MGTTGSRGSMKSAQACYFVQLGKVSKKLDVFCKGHGSSFLRETINIPPAGKLLRRTIINTSAYPRCGFRRRYAHGKMGRPRTSRIAKMCQPGLG